MPADIDAILSLADEPIEVHPPRAKAAVYLRWPTFAEWHAVSVAHRQLAGKDPPAELIAETVAICVANADGSRKYADPKELLAASPRLLMWLYVKCWETVLRNDEPVVKEEEKN